jgi:hypothetical protein
MSGAILAGRSLHMAAGIEDHDRDRGESLGARMRERRLDRTQGGREHQVFHCDFLSQRTKPKVTK